MKRLLPSFFQHARRMERQHGEAPLDLLRDFQQVRKSLSDPWITELPEEPYLLAFMQLPLALRHWLEQCVNPKPAMLTVLFANAAFYLNRLVKAKGVPEVLFQANWELDPDRHDFDVETVRMLLDYGAEPRKAWEIWLGVIDKSYTDANIDDRKRYLEVSYEISKRGPTGQKFEEPRLTRVFRRTDALWLIKVRDQALASKPWRPFSLWRK